MVIKFWARARLRVRYALEYSGENPKFDENRSKILQNHIVIELDDLRASFWVMTLVDGAKRIYFIQAFWW